MCRGIIVHNLIKIEFPSAIEIISIKFDDALELANKDAIVYGGVVRDMLAGLPLSGDLDIIASYDSYYTTLENFRMSGKWVEDYDHRKSRMVDEILRPSGYKDNKNINRTTTFKTFANTKVQLIQAMSQDTKDTFETNLKVVKSVDIICCGLIMDVNGNIFEVLDNAYDDCLNRILRLNKSEHTLNIQTLQERIEKLSDRGWVSKINIEKVKKMVAEIKVAKQKEPVKRLDIDIEKYVKVLAGVRPYESKIIVDIELVKKLGGVTLVKNIAQKSAKMAGIRCKTSPITREPSSSSFIIYLEHTHHIKETRRFLIDNIVRSLSLIPKKHSYKEIGRRSFSRSSRKHSKNPTLSKSELEEAVKMVSSEVAMDDGSEIEAWDRQELVAHATPSDEPDINISDESVRNLEFVRGTGRCSEKIEITRKMHQAEGKYMSEVVRKPIKKSSTKKVSWSKVNN